MKALSYDNLIRLAVNRGDKDLERELRADKQAEEYYKDFYKSTKEEKIILN